GQPRRALPLLGRSVRPGPRRPALSARDRVAHPKAVPVVATASRTGPGPHRRPRTRIQPGRPTTARERTSLHLSRLINPANITERQRRNSRGMAGVGSNRVPDRRPRPGLPLTLRDRREPPALLRGPLRFFQQRAEGAEAVRRLDPVPAHHYPA